MKLGAYEFEWVPDEMDIPRPEKTVAVQENLGGVGFFSWGTQLIGKVVKMKWKFTSVAQYEAFKALYLAGGVHVLDLSSEVMIYDDGTPIEQDPALMTYPDPAHPGEVGGPTYRRFYVGPIWNAEGVGNAQWPDITDNDHKNVEAYYQAFYDPQGWPTVDEGSPKALDLTDPVNAWIEFDVKQISGVALPNWRPGSILYDNMGSVWTVVLPWDSAVRPYWLYPVPLPETTKIYYKAWDLGVISLYPEVSGSGSHFGGVRAYPNCTQIGNSWFSENGWSVITECGEDAHGTWFKCRADVAGGYAQIKLCAGEQPYWWDQMTSTWGSIDIYPWGP